jgi:hypothetical protein
MIRKAGVVGPCPVLERQYQLSRAERFEQMADHWEASALDWLKAAEFSRQHGDFVREGQERKYAIERQSWADADRAKAAEIRRGVSCG